MLPELLPPSFCKINIQKVDKQNPPILQNQLQKD